MDSETTNLIQVTIAVGAIVISALSILIAFVWRISKGLTTRDESIKAALEQINVLSQGLEEHEKTCVKFREDVDRRFYRGQRRFDRVEMGIALIMGKMGIDTRLLPKLPDDCIESKDD